MIKSKLKLCDGVCSEHKVIWKNHGGKRYCKSCWSAHSCKTSIKPTVKQKKLPPRSLKRIIADKKYSKLRKKFLEQNPMCQAHLPGICSTTSTQVHHKAGRVGKLFLDITKWLAVCHHCHVWIEQHPVQAKELGYSLDRL